MVRPQRGYADTETGEVFDLIAVPRERAAGGFVMAQQAALERLTTAANCLKLGDYQVLMALFARLDWDNFLHLDLSDLAKKLGRDRAGLSRAVARLVAEGVLIRGPKVGRSHTYRLDPNLGWKGTPRGRAALSAQLAERGWGGLVEADPTTEADEALPGL